MPPQNASDSRSASQFSSSNQTNLYSELERRRTFVDWPVPFLSAASLASAGFYYLRIEDVVKCIFCGIEVGKWEPGDVPLQDHQKWSPACKFVQKVANENIPINDSDNQSSDSGYDTCGESGTKEMNDIGKCPDSKLEKLGVQKHRPPSFPAYSTIDSRLRTFESWPISLKLKPATLSEAGFFYTGKGDQTICFHCGGGLKDWEETDEPWKEHARWFVKCPFVMAVKGKQFIEEANGMGKIPHQEQKPVGSSMENLTHTTNNLTSLGGHGQQAEIVKSDISQANTNKSDGRLCKICCEEEMGVVFLPCGHIIACTNCAIPLSTCAICRSPIQATVRAFLS